MKNLPAKFLSIGEIDSLELIELIANDITEHQVIFDIGANIGTWTLLAKSFLPNARVYAFEPLEKHIVEFETNCSGTENVFIQKYCVGNENKTDQLNVSSFSDSSSLLDATPLEFQTYHIKKEKEVQVQVRKLSTLINQDELPVPDILKLDIQGYELEALKGLENYIHQVRYIICEVSFKEYYKGQPLFNDVVSYLAKYGLTLFALGKNTPIGEELDQIDILFKRI
ncbi:FkbM family methyltransferase [Pedobacter aquatilis]|uniref:FkbM family methyltransferase n=1 Tax=Pedobacter aquatilis TaxID=351343 RepID=UPI002931F577|nr:FkbM family methyltransferase [Pedobacter aquatilis]